MRDLPHPTCYLTDNVVREDNIVHMDIVLTWVENDPIWAARGKAIQGYAQIENALSSLWALLTGMSVEDSALIFYKNASAGSRSATTEKLLHKKFGNQYNLFWNAFFLTLRTIDNRRNEIAHWLSAVNMGIGNDRIVRAGVMLVPPASFFPQAAVGPSVTTQDMQEFQERCEECARLITMCQQATKPNPEFPAALLQTWLETFRQPFVYPLPAQHPLNQQIPAPDNQLQPWPE
jgi:hypothetical protein